MGEGHSIRSHIDIRKFRNYILLFLFLGIFVTLCWFLKFAPFLLILSVVIPVIIIPFPSFKGLLSRSRLREWFKMKRGIGLKVLLVEDERPGRGLVKRKLRRRLMK